jgi:hypothetical protein
MIIRATKKLLNISRINSVKNESIILCSLAGEWYASLLSTGRHGFYAIHFLHNPTMISIIIPGKSLTKALQILPSRVTSLLGRNGFQELESGFQLDTKIEVYTTNSRNILANMNQMKFDLEYRLAMAESLELNGIENIEDMQLSFIIGGKIADGKYIMPKEKLKQLLDNLGSR